MNFNNNDVITAAATTTTTNSSSITIITIRSTGYTDTDISCTLPEHVLEHFLKLPSMLCYISSQNTSIFGHPHSSHPFLLATSFHYILSSYYIIKTLYYIETILILAVEKSNDLI